MFPENSKAVPVTKPHTHPSGIKQVQARTCRAPNRHGHVEHRKQRDTHKRQETEDPPGGNRSIPTAPGNRHGNRRTHNSPTSHQPNSEGLPTRGQNHQTHSLPSKTCSLPAQGIV
ncbi:Hypothetical predicted protein [Pelobates cultripes]|uniref:Uncharacterized protein n=1 Tax=Pelobates cultripes TaxID=61616 RepID=A0AAD1SC58_PELCU|nr:Hypothetical predicted protein [Pelobates cultripes]